MNDSLSTRLHAAAPEPPDLVGLAERAEAQGRRRRTLTRVAIGAAAAVVLAAVVVPAVIVGDLDATPSDGPSGTACVSESELDAGGIAESGAAWVRFCAREDGQTMVARFPSGVLEGKVAEAVVDGWRGRLEEGEPPERCVSEESFSMQGRNFRIQVGLTDGRVVMLEGTTGSCPVDAGPQTIPHGELVYRQLLAAVSTDLAGRYEAGGPALPDTCPDRLRTDLTNTDGASAELLVGEDRIDQLSTRPLLALPASDTLVCRYTGYRSTLALEDSWTTANPGAEGIRVAALVHYSDGMADCDLDPRRPSYVVVLRDKTGTARTFAIDGPSCSPLSGAIGRPPEEQYFGLVRAELIDAIEGTRP
jgi:hypothetical protein